MVGINVAMQFEHVQRGGDTTTTVLFGLCGMFSVFAALAAAAFAAATLALTAATLALTSASLALAAAALAAAAAAAKLPRRQLLSDDADHTDLGE